MTSVLFILTAILVAYILYMVFSSSGTAAPSYAPAKKSEQDTSSVSAGNEGQSATGEKPQIQVTKFRDPKTGNKASNPTNYRFAKRWIKDALVSEGLLDRLYKNTELNDSEINERIKDALDRFKELKKYHDE